MKRQQQILIVLLASLVVLPLQASDREKEQRWANQIVDFLIDGEPVWLGADGNRFLGIYTPATTENEKGTVILLHGRGAHPDWPQLIQPLRTRLPGEGWSTLSLQMPVLANEAKDEDYVPLFSEVPSRIQAGLDYIEQQGSKHTFLLAHSLATNMATYSLANHHDSRVSGLVGIGMSGLPRQKANEVLDNVPALLRIRVPVLDVYAEQTSDHILKSVDRRAYAVYQTGNLQSRQVMVSGAGHFFQGHEDQLLKIVTSWFNEIAGEVKDGRMIVLEK